MHQKGFPPLFISWLNSYIFDTYYSIFLDGSLTGFFHTTTGIRQVYPLSPYLFSIAMDAFFAYINANSLSLVLKVRIYFSLIYYILMIFLSLVKLIMIIALFLMRY